MPEHALFEYETPETVADAARLLARGEWTIMAGGTDLYPAAVGRPLSSPVLDVSRIDGFRDIRRVGDQWRIGGGATWTDVINAPLPAAFDGLKQAARQVGSVQVQNAATVAGNLCNASPAADGVPPLLTLEASVELSSDKGTRTLPLRDFITGNRRTRIEAGELLGAILVPAGDGDAVSRFLKLGSREYLVISIVSVALLLRTGDDGRITDARIAVGACSEVARRLPALERNLIGRLPGPALADCVTPDHLAPLSPIDDVRAGAAYRLEAALELLRRGLTEDPA